MARSNRHKTRVTPVRKHGRVTAIGAKGDGLVELEDGARAYAPLTVPGDEGVFDVTGDRASIAELTTTGPARIDPDCPNYGVCGGCALQHVFSDFYGDWKRQLIVDALARHDIHCKVAPIIRMPAASRRRAVFAVQKTNNGILVGFNQRRSSRITSIDGCRVLRADLADAMPALSKLAEAIPATAFDLAVTAADNGIDVDIRSRRFRNPDPRTLTRVTGQIADLPFIRVALNGEVLLQKTLPMVEIGAARVTPPPGGFLQASREGEAALADLVVPPLKDAKRIADLFCGMGAFALRLASFADVYAADGSAPAVAALARAAKEAAQEIKPVTCEVRNLDERPLMAADLNRFDAVVFDPPRAGAAVQAGELAASSVRDVIAVSCNPATFARDARLLLDGGYQLIKVTPVDQFVYSAHIELVGVFQRPRSSRRPR